MRVCGGGSGCAAELQNEGRMDSQHQKRWRLRMFWNGRLCISTKPRVEVTFPTRSCKFIFGFVFISITTTMTSRLPSVDTTS